LQKLAGTACTLPMPANTNNKPDPAAATPHYHGHRERLGEWFYGAGPEALSDYELLEMALFPAPPRRDTKPLAKLLLKKFGSFAEVIQAPVARLREVEGIGEASINQIKLLAAAANRAAKGEIKTSVALSSWNDVIDDVRSGMAFADEKQFRLLFLDKRNQLIADEVQQTGTVDHTPVYPREVIKRALELSATALMLVHNHPSAIRAVAGRHPDDQGDRRYRHPARHFHARPHHRRQTWPCEPEGSEVDLRRRQGPNISALTVRPIAVPPPQSRPACAPAAKPFQAPVPI
jgi:DNA repair protein RadC